MGEVILIINDLAYRFDNESQCIEVSTMVGGQVVGDWREEDWLHAVSQNDFCLAEVAFNAMKQELEAR